MARIILVIIVLVATFFGGFMVSQYSPFGKVNPLKNNQVSSTGGYTNIVATFNPLPETTLQSYPILQDGLLVLSPINTEDKTAIPTDVKVAGVLLGYARINGIATTIPDPSPDLKKIAYITDNSLWIMTADGKNKVNIPNLVVDSIRSWAPDSKKLIVTSPLETLDSLVIYGMGEPEIKPNTTFPINRMRGGNYLVDIEKGEVTSLYPTDSAYLVYWIGPNKLLIETSSSSNSQVYIFDITNFTGDAQTFSTLAKDYFGRHFSADSSGKKWAVSVGNTGDDASNPANVSSSNIVIADFPSLQGTTVEQGTWAQVQAPNISPSGTKVMYVAHFDLTTQWHIRIWDGVNKLQVENARPVMWVDDNQFIYESILEEQKNKLFLHNLQTNITTPLN